MREYCEHDITKGTCIHCFNALNDKIADLERQLRISVELDRQHCNRLQDLTRERSAERERVKVMREGLETLRVAVNDKQPDPGAVGFIDRTLRKAFPEEGK